jgi:hypothetical protein
MERPDWISRDTLTGMMVVTGAGFVLLAVLAVGLIFFVFVYEPEVKSIQDAVALAALHHVQELFKPIVPTLLKTECAIAFLLAQGLLVTYWAYAYLGGKYAAYDDITRWLSLALPVLLVEFILAFGVMALVTLYVIAAFIFSSGSNKPEGAPWVFGGIGLFDLLLFGFIALSLWVRAEIKSIKAGASAARI